MPLPKLRRYFPPVRTSISQDSSVMPIDRGTHHCLNSSGCDHALNTSRAGAANVRVTTTSRSEVRSTVVGFAGLLSLPATIALLLHFELFDHAVQSVETRGPELVESFDPGGFFLETARPEPAVAHAADLLGAYEAGGLEHADVLL